MYVKVSVFTRTKIFKKVNNVKTLKPYFPETEKKRFKRSEQ